MESIDTNFLYYVLRITHYAGNTVSGMDTGIVWRICKMNVHQSQMTNVHKWGAIGMWTMYVWTVTLAGLAIHPYKSVRRMVLDKPILLPVILSPVLGLLALFVLGRVGSYVWTLGNMGRELMAFVLGSTLIGLLMWQGLLLILMMRFWRVR